MRATKIWVALMAAIVVGLGSWERSPNEARAIPQVFVVTSVADTGGNVCAVNCTLRQAINNSNLNADSDTITFNLGAGVQTITPAAALPIITDDVIIDGGGTPNSAAIGATIDTAFRVRIDGTGTPAGTRGLTFATASGASVVRGLVITNFPSTGIREQGAGGTLAIEGNFIGIREDGTTAAGNGAAGIENGGATGTTITIGGNTPAKRNLISANATAIVLTGGTGHAIEGNYIGLDKTGTLGRGNGTGVNISGTLATNVGGPAATQMNIISGATLATGDGVIVSGSLTIQNNRIGTNALGTAAIPNADDGVAIGGPSNVTIGGPGATAGNLISGNGDTGIRASSGTGPVLIQRNFIGLDVSGTLPLGNGSHGIALTGSLATVGGSGPGLGNRIAGNGGSGIDVQVAASNVTVQGNTIGVLGAPNAVGVRFLNTGTGTVGGSGIGEGNVVQHNLAGVQVLGSTQKVTVRGNSIANNGTGLQFDLGTNGQGTNDTGDGDAGVNTLLNHPELLQFVVAGGLSFANLKLNTSPNLVVDLEFFTGPCIAGRVHPQTLIHTTTQDSGPTGVKELLLGIGGAHPIGTFLVVNATDNLGNSSEFNPGCSAAQLPPEVHQFMPASVKAGGPDFALVLTGENLFPHHHVTFDGFEILPNVVSFGTSLVVDVQEAQIATPGQKVVFVSVGGQVGVNNVFPVRIRSASDANCSDTVTGADALAILITLAGLDGGVQTCANQLPVPGDADLNNFLELADVTYVLKVTAGQIPA